MELMLWAFTLIHRSNHMVIDADYFSRLNTDLHIDPLLAQYDELAQIMYKRYTPPTGDINPETLPGFRHKRSKATSNLINVKSSDISQIRNIPVKFGTDDFGENNLGNATRCMNMCQKSPKSSSYCQNLWKHFEPSENLPLPEAHFVFLVTLGGLFLLSIVEDLIERFAKWGPYRKLYDYETKNGFQAKFLD